jgi:hypothetical protein
MVMVITFLTLTNIALGYGLAIYVHKHFGTLMYRRKPKAVAAAISQVTSAGEVATAAVSPTGEAPAPVASSAPAAGPVVAEAAAPPAQAEVAAKAETAAVEVQAESDTVDEENVLAGIEEFRSQLAKMSETTEQFADESQPELVGAAN